MSGARPLSRLARPAAALMLGAALGLGLVAPAEAQAAGNTMEVDGRVEADGRLRVSQTITFGGEVPERLQQRISTTEATLDKAHHVFEIEDVTARADAMDLTAQVDVQDEQVVVSVDTARAIGRPITIDYTVVGAARQAPAVEGSPDRTELRWALLQGIDLPFSEVSGQVQTPGTISFVECEAGPVQRQSPCTTFAGGTHDSPQPTFSDGPRKPGEVVTLDFALPSEVVAPNARLEHEWSLDRAFTVSRSTVLASLLPLLLGGFLLWMLHRRTGRDGAGGEVTPIAEFTPVAAGESRFTVLEDVRPGHIGTVADERVDPIDITATLLDLAVRGWLTIVELPRESAHKPLDWSFERREQGEGELRPYEARLLDAVAPAGGPAAAVSTIAEAVTPVVEQVQEMLYDEVVHRGWFDRSPHQTRSRWGLVAWGALFLAMAATILLVLFTTYGLLGFALTALALGGLVIAQEMPRRTARGSALLAGLSALASQLQTQPTTQMPHGEELEELSRVLPYAIVLGGRERWVRALVAADDDDTPDGDDLSWYRAPGDWHLRDLPDSLNAFIVTVQGQLFGR